MNIILPVPAAHVPVSPCPAGSISGAVTGSRVMACAAVICVCTGNPLRSAWGATALAGGAVGGKTSPCALAAQLREVSSGLAAPRVLDTFTGGVC